MAKLTITLSDARYRVLKETAARPGKTIGATIEECLDRAGIKTVASAADLVARARRRSGLSETAALALAVKETRAAPRDLLSGLRSQIATSRPGPPRR